jgi:hypothetical protein
LNSRQSKNRLPQLNNYQLNNFDPENEKDGFDQEESKSVPCLEENKDANTSFPKELPTEENNDEEDELKEDAPKENENKEGEQKENDFKDDEPKAEEDHKNDEEDQKNQEGDQQPEGVFINELPAPVEDPLETRFNALETDELKQWVVNSTIDKFNYSGKNVKYGYHGYVKNENIDQEYV